MTSKATVGFLLLLAVAGGWWAGRTSPPLLSGGEPDQAAALAAAGKAGPGSASAPAMGGQVEAANAAVVAVPDTSTKLSGAAPASKAAQIKAGSGPLHEYRFSTDLRALVDRLMAAGGNNISREAKVAVALAMEECLAGATKSGDTGWEHVLRNVAADSPTYAARKAAAQREAQRCAGFADRRYNRGDVERLWRELEQSGSDLARARQLGRSRSGEAATADDLAAMQRALASGDPLALRYLSSYYSRLKEADLRLGPNREPVDPSALYAGLQLAACQLGADCSANSRPMLIQCITTGRCDALDVDEQMRRNQLAPERYLDANRYRDLIVAAIQSGDWSALNLNEPVPFAQRDRNPPVDIDVPRGLENSIGASTVNLQRNRDQYSLTIVAPNRERMEAIMRRLQGL